MSKTEPQRVAAIDIGTNSVLLLIAERSEGTPVAVLERATITRLGRDVDRTRSLAPEAILDTLRCLQSYAACFGEHRVDCVEVVSTSAARDARNGADFLERARDMLGADVRVIDGDEEARLTFDGAMSGLTLGGPVTVFDVGGGSTEIIQGNSTSSVTEIDIVRSLDVGSVRLTERHVQHDPPLLEELEAVRVDVRAALAGLGRGATAHLVGVAGTVTTLAAIDQGLSVYDATRVHGSTLSSSAVNGILQRLAGVTLSERRKMTGLEPARADVIVSGTLIVSEIFAWSGRGQVIVSDRGVRWGLALRALRP